MNKNVQIIHIEGEKKGAIESFNQNSISFGRNPKCDVIFPADLLIISRLHAKIDVKDNQFIFNNLGANGCYVNGQKHDTTTLRSGDVITFAEGGPKLSFLVTKINSPLEKKTPSSRKQTQSNHDQNIKQSKARLEIGSKPGHEFTIQCGLVIKSFVQQKMTIGKNQHNDFQIENPNLSEKHIELYFSGDDCYIRRIGTNSKILINGKRLIEDTLLPIGSEVSLSDYGPCFNYLGEGRLSEINQHNLDRMQESINYKRPEYVGVNEKPTLMDAVKSVLFRRY